MPTPVMTSPRQSHPPRQPPTTVAQDGEPAARLPNERDASSDSSGDAPRDVIRQAHDDLESGKSATDRSEVTDEVYRRQTVPDKPPKPR